MRNCLIPLDAEVFFLLVFFPFSLAKAAFLNFGYAFSLSNGSLDINGLNLPVDMSGLMDTFDPKDFETAIQDPQKRINQAKSDGARLPVMFFSLPITFLPAAKKFPSSTPRATLSRTSAKKQ